MTGMKKKPCLAKAKTELELLCPVLWNTIPLKVLKADRGIRMHWYRMATVPMAMTAGSERNNNMM